MSRPDIEQAAIRVMTYPEMVAGLGTGRCHLLLGNGFSIACDPIFSYDKLFRYAAENGLTTTSIAVFNRLGTNNFEGVMRLLEDSSWVVEEYGLLPPSQAENPLVSDLKAVKEALIKAVAHTHLAHSGSVEDARKRGCANFLANYHNVFTTNYDLLLYWVEMSELTRLQGRDGFRADADDPDQPYVVFTEHVGEDKGIFFIHGALHLYTVKGEVRKHCWSRTQEPLITQIKQSLEAGEYPLFVAEGYPDKKLEQIQRSGYLSYCLGKLQRIQNCLVVFGLGFGESDQHIAHVISHNKQLKKVIRRTVWQPKFSGESGYSYECCENPT
jgi:hypothetical protein